MNVEGYDIRFSEMEDLLCLDRWLSSPRDCDPFPFDFEEKEEAVRNWIGFSRFKASLTGVLHETPCAIGTLFLMPYRKVAHHASFFLIVDPLHRRKGIGRSMVRNLLHLAKSRFRLESVQMEVLGDNPMILLGKSLGFEPFLTQEGFVKIDGNPHSRTLMEHFFS